GGGPAWAGGGGSGVRRRPAGAITHPLSAGAGRTEPPGHRVRELPGAARHGRAAGPGDGGDHSAIAELERNLIVERVKAGLRRARLEGRRIGRPSLSVDREALGRDRERGLSLTELAELH